MNKNVKKGFLPYVFLLLMILGVCYFYTVMNPSIQHFLSISYLSIQKSLGY